MRSLQVFQEIDLQDIVSDRQPSGLGTGGLKYASMFTVDALSMKPTVLECHSLIRFAVPVRTQYARILGGVQVNCRFMAKSSQFIFGMLGLHRFRGLATLPRDLEQSKPRLL